MQLITIIWLNTNPGKPAIIRDSVQYPSESIAYLESIAYPESIAYLRGVRTLVLRQKMGSKVLILYVMQLVYIPSELVCRGYCALQDVFTKTDRPIATIHTSGCFCHVLMVLYWNICLELLLFIVKRKKEDTDNITAYMVKREENYDVNLQVEIEYSAWGKYVLCK